MKLAFGAGMTRMKLCNEKLTFTASGQRIELTREQVGLLRDPVTLIELHN